MQRGAFPHLQTAIFAGTITMMVVWKLDRLARSLKEGINVRADWCQHGVRIIAITQQRDLSGPVGPWRARVLCGLAAIA
jgi:DNA invertase Pin-like site-specific DNA recombinase